MLRAWAYLAAFTLVDSGNRTAIDGVMDMVGISCKLPFLWDFHLQPWETSSLVMDDLSWRTYKFYSSYLVRQTKPRRSLPDLIGIESFSFPF